MMKLAISFDEIGLDNTCFGPFPNSKSNFDTEIADFLLMNFLENQFPNWDIGTVFPEPAEYDFDNMEITLQMEII